MPALDLLPVREALMRQAQENQSAFESIGGLIRLDASGHLLFDADRVRSELSRFCSDSILELQLSQMDELREQGVAIFEGCLIPWMTIEDLAYVWGGLPRIFREDLGVAAATTGD